MHRLQTLFASFAARCDARFWIGPRPDVRDGLLARTIAQQIGYPTASAGPFVGDGLLRLTRPQAAHVLAVAGTVSLAYDTPSPRQSRIRDAADALGDMAPDAVFLGNGLWDPQAPLSWTSLTSATFDCGLIGHDADHAFIFWVEEED